MVGEQNWSSAAVSRTGDGLGASHFHTADIFRAQIGHQNKDLMTFT